MEKLKKLFPLSFKYCKNVKSLILCAFLYILIEVGCGFVAGLIVEPIVSTIIGTVLSPITAIGVFGYIIAIVLCCTGVGAIIGIPLIIISLPFMMVGTVVTSLVMTIVYSFFTAYTMVGCTLAVLAYAGFFGEITFPEKKKKEKKAAEDAPAAE